MFLSRFGVKNYKCLVDIDIPLTPIHVLIGQNDAGKTSLLEALEVFYGSSRKPFLGLLPEPWDGRDLVFHGAPAPQIDLSGEWELGGEISRKCGYGFSITFDSTDKNLCQSFQEHAKIVGTDHNFSSPGAATRIYELLHSGNSSDEVSILTELLGGVQRYSLNAKAMAMPAALDAKRNFRLDPDGFGLPTLLADIAEYDSKLIEGVREKFLNTFTQFTRLRTETTKSYRRDYTPDGLRFSTVEEQVGKTILFDTASGGTLTGEQVSDGVILVLGFLALAHTPNPPKLLLIEEPENGIYPQRLQEVIGLLREMTQRSDGVPFPQIIMSTHSPYILSMFEPEEVTFLSRRADDPAAGVRARPMRDAPRIQERLGGGEFYLGELWYNLDEEELFGEP